MAVRNHLHAVPHESVMANEQFFDGANEQLVERQALNEELRGVGKIALLYTRNLSDPSVEVGGRSHDFITAEVDGFKHRMWVTEPIFDAPSPLTVIAKPGLGEVIEDGVAFTFHRELSQQLAGATIISHATHGVGDSADRIPFRELRHHGIHQMAEQGLKLIEAYRPNDRIVFVGISMGTVIGNHLLNLNLEKGSPVNFEGVVNFAPAIVKPEDIPREMLLKFVPSMTLGLANQLFLKTRPQDFIKTMKDLARSKPSRHDLGPFGRQIYDLVQGVPEERIDQNLEGYDVSVIGGTKDPVARIPMWLEKQEKFPGLHVEPVEGRGHDIATAPIKAARKVSEEILRREWYYQPRQVSA